MKMPITKPKTQFRTITLYAADPDIIYWLDGQRGKLGESRSEIIRNILAQVKATDEVLEDDTTFGEDRDVMYKIRKAVEKVFLKKKR